MSSALVFAIQWLWFLLAWSALAVFLVVPWLRRQDPYRALSVCVAPHLFRVLGVGLLVPNLSPGMPTAFAVSTAIGDGLTAALALLSLCALHTRSRHAGRVVWVFNLFGSIDLAFAMGGAVRIGAAAYLEAQWYVPALGVPLMVVAHALVFWLLVTRPPGRGGEAR